MVRPGDRGYTRAALDACVADLESAPVPIAVERTWTLADGFCVVYTYPSRPGSRFGYCARAVPSSEFFDPVEWGESVAVDLWGGPPTDAELVHDAGLVGW